MNDSSEEIQHERVTPERVASVTHNGMRYEAEELSPADASVNTGTDHVRAYDEATGALLWDIQLPSESTNAEQEGDKQWAFITSLAITDGKLVVTNEREEVFHLDPKTGILE